AAKIAPQISQTTSARWLAKASLTTDSMIQAVNAVVSATRTRQVIANAYPRIWSRPFSAITRLRTLVTVPESRCGFLSFAAPKKEHPVRAWRWGPDGPAWRGLYRVKPCLTSLQRLRLPGRSYRCQRRPCVEMP